MNIRIRSKKSDKETTVLWKKEAERLQIERNELLTKLNSINRYKLDYENLIKETKMLKERYLDLIVAVEDIFEEYKSKLQKL